MKTQGPVRRTFMKTVRRSHEGCWGYDLTQRHGCQEDPWGYLRKSMVRPTAAAQQSTELVRELEAFHSRVLQRLPMSLGALDGAGPPRRQPKGANRQLVRQLHPQGVNRGPAQTGPRGGKKKEGDLLLCFVILFFLKPGFLHFLVKLINYSWN